MKKTDIEIAQEATLETIKDIAEKIHLYEDQIEYYGKYKAKIDSEKIQNEQEGKVILVTAITPTPAGEGKTTTAVGLGDALNSIGKRAIVVLREPSLGPVFGIKGGAAGGGYAQVVPMEDINLHFTGDFHAIGAANNLLAALIDNHIFHGNTLKIDNRKITWKRAIDMNDRQLRHIVDGMGGNFNGIPREDGFEITVASEIMAILCLAKDISELKEMLGNIIVGYTREDKPVTASDLNAQGAMAALLREAIKPNLVQTLENNPAIIHGGPFANIAHGCNSVIATKTAMKLADYVVTEAGFGGDLGAEKFIDIKCRKAQIKPSALVLVATVRALKMHGGLARDQLTTENLAAIKAGLPNLLKHLENATEVYGLPTVVAINKFPTDTDDEIQLIVKECEKYQAKVVLSDVWERGGEGGKMLAQEVVHLVEEKNHFSFVYPDEASIKEKIEIIVKKVYGGKGADYTRSAEKEIAKLEKLGFGHFPICMAKTQYSFSDDQTRIGRPKDFKIQVTNVKVSAGAEFIVIYTGNVMTMPGLPKIPSAERINISREGVITGLF